MRVEPEFLDRFLALSHFFHISCLRFLCLPCQALGLESLAMVKLEERIFLSHLFQDGLSQVVAVVEQEKATQV